MPIFTPLNEATFSTLHEDIIASRIREFEKSPNAEHIAVGLRVFHDDVKAVIRDNPSLMQDTAVTARLGFSDVVFPDDQRNDIYIKLWSGDFPSLTSGTSKLGRIPVNIEVEAEVRSQNGKVVANAISRGKGESHTTRFTSTVYRNNASPSE
jgi:dedicator of cytokinesis protein 3